MQKDPKLCLFIIKKDLSHDLRGDGEKIVVEKFISWRIKR